MKNKFLITIILITILFAITIVSAIAEDDNIIDNNVSEFENSNDIIIESSPDTSYNKDLSNENIFNESNSDESKDSYEDSFTEESSTDDSTTDFSDSSENSEISSIPSEDESNDNPFIESEDESINESFDESNFDDEEFSNIESEISSETSENNTSDESTDESYNDSDDETNESTSDNSENQNENITHNIKITQSNGGKVSLSQTTAIKGEKINIEITVSKGYELFSITVNGKTINNRTFTMPDEDVEIVVKFVKTQTNESSQPSKDETSTNVNSSTSKDESKAQNTSQPEKYYNISITSNGEGTIDVDKNKATKGTRIIVTVKPADGYKLEYIEFNNTKITEIGEKYAFTMPSKDVIINACFIKIEDPNESSNDSTTNSSVPDISNDISVPDESEISEESIEISYSDISALDESNINELSENSDYNNNKNSSPLLFIVPIIILIGMIGSIITFFARKNNNTF